MTVNNDSKGSGKSQSRYNLMQCPDGFSQPRQRAKNYHKPGCWCPGRVLKREPYEQAQNLRNN
jgi:hypothetical protein